MFNRVQVPLMWAVGLAALSACSSEPVPEAPVRPVRAIQVVTPQQLAETRFDGVAESVDVATMAFRVGGQIEEICVDVGDEVEAGDVLARLDVSDLDLSARQLVGQLNQARAQLDEMRAGAREEEVEILRAQLRAAMAGFNAAEAEFRRYESLLEDNTISRAEYDRVESAYETALAEQQSAEQRLREAEAGARAENIRAQEAVIASLEAQLETARNSVSYATLRAPFSGIIAERLIEPFEQVSTMTGPGTPVFVLQSISELEMTVGVPEDYMRFRTLVVSTEVTLTSIPDHVFEAEIVNIGVDVDAVTRTYPVTVRFENPEDGIIEGSGELLRHRLALPGMTGEIWFRVPAAAIAEGGTLVPRTAVFERPDGSRAAWVIEDGMVRRRGIVLGGLMARDMLGITEGLATDEWVVTAGIHSLQEGQRVRILSVPRERGE
jgi:membrane fusion protein, multidrug efflux system